MITRAEIELMKQDDKPQDTEATAMQAWAKLVDLGRAPVVRPNAVPVRDTSYFINPKNS